MSDWVILRTSGRHTLRLAESLGDDGFEVWTPAETRRIRIPRANVRREVKLPIMPSYVFARARHLIDLLQMAAMPFKPRRGAGCRLAAHPDFSVMHYNDSIPLIGDQQLQGLRRLEVKRNPRKKAERLPTGLEVKVRVEGGSFAGMHGRVEKSDDLHTLVCFSDRLTVKIATSLLEPGVVVDRSSVAVRKAA